MKKRLLFLAALALTPLAALGADAALAPAPDAPSLVTSLTPVLVPVVIALVKWIAPRIPSHYLPLLAPLLGALADFCTTRQLGTSTALGAALGAAGVGVREVVDQWRQQWDSARGILNLLVLGLVLATASGCASFSTRIEETMDDGSARVTVIRTHTLFDSKSELSKLRTSHTGKTQSVSLGALSQESSGTNAVSLLEAAVGAAVKAATGK